MIPKTPGKYYWDEWGKLVDVVRQPRSKKLYVKVPGGIDVRVSPRLAGSFTKVRIVGEADAPHPQPDQGPRVPAPEPGADRHSD